MTSERGFALLAVMLVLALLGVVVAEFAFSMRLEATMVRSYKEDIIGLHLAEAAVEQAIREILTDAPLQGFAGEEPLLTFFRSPTQPLPRLPRSEVKLGPGQFAYRITDEEGRLNLNTTPPDRVDRLLVSLGVEKQVRDTINDSLQDWKDPDDLHRLSGAESDDYLRLPVPYRARNGRLEDLAEMLQIKGVTPVLYHGSAGQPGLVQFVTVHGGGQVNINTAAEPVLKAVGLSEAEVSEIVQSRRNAPYATVPPRFTGRGLAAGSRTYRIEAAGWVGGGETRVRTLAIVQRTAEAGTGQPAALILSWNPSPRTRP